MFSKKIIYLERSLFMVFLGLSLSCGNDTVVQDKSVTSTVKYGDFDMTLYNVNALVPHGLGLSSLLSPMTSQGQALTIAAGLDFKSLQDRIDLTLRTSDIDECQQAMPLHEWVSQPLDQVTCFGPELSYEGHPDASADGTIAENKLGMWWDYADVKSVKGESCGAELMNQLNGPSNYLGQSSIGILSWGICAARIERDELPEVGSSIDLLQGIDSTTLQDQYGFSLEHFEVMAADTNQALFTSDISGSMTIDGSPASFTSKINHRIKDESYEEYIGFIQTVVTLNDESVIVYSLKYELLDGTYRTISRQIIDESNQGSYFSESTKLIDLTYADMSYKWIEIVSEWSPDGNYKQSVIWPDDMNMMVNGKTDLDGNGSVYFGYNSKDSSDEAYHTIEGMACFPDVDEGYELYPGVQKQSLKVNEDSGLWEVESSDIVFVPTNSCDVAFVIGFPASKNDYIKIVNGPMVNNLYEIESYEEDWDLITLPGF